MDTVFMTLIGVVLPYITLAVLVVGLTMRIARWRKAPQGKMTLYPGSESGMPMWKKIASEVLIFKSLFQGNKGLWAGSWIFHAMLALIIFGHSRVFFEALFFLPSTASQDLVSGLTGGTFGVVLLITAVYLLIRRVAVQSVREISDFEDFFALFLILAIVLTGDAMRLIAVLGDHHDLMRGEPGTRAYFLALLTNPAGALALMPKDPYFVVHFLLGQILFIYMPFSKFLHIPGVFFSQAAIQKV